MTLVLLKGTFHHQYVIFADGSISQDLDAEQHELRLQTSPTHLSEKSTTTRPRRLACLLTKCAQGGGGLSTTGFASHMIPVARHHNIAAVHFALRSEDPKSALERHDTSHRLDIAQPHPHTFTYNLLQPASRL